MISSEQFMLWGRLLPRLSGIITLLAVFLFLMTVPTQSHADCSIFYDDFFEDMNWQPVFASTLTRDVNVSEGSLSVRGGSNSVPAAAAHEIPSVSPPFRIEVDASTCSLAGFYVFGDGPETAFSVSFDDTSYNNIDGIGAVYDKTYGRLKFISFDKGRKQWIWSKKHVPFTWCYSSHQLGLEVTADSATLLLNGERLLSVKGDFKESLGTFNTLWLLSRGHSDNPTYENVCISRPPARMFAVPVKKEFYDRPVLANSILATDPEELSPIGFPGERPLKELSKLLVSFPAQKTAKNIYISLQSDSLSKGCYYAVSSDGTLLRTSSTHSLPWRRCVTEAIENEEIGLKFGKYCGLFSCCNPLSLPAGNYLFSFVAQDALNPDSYSSWIYNVTIGPSLDTSFLMTDVYATSYHPLPDTGQIRCHDPFWNEISCVGTGRDGEYYGLQPSFRRYPDYKGTGDDITLDVNTGLMWMSRTADTNSDGTVDFDDALSWDDAQHYCSNLHHAGMDDWRVPDIFELSSIVDHGVYDPNYQQPVVDSSAFNVMTNVKYWSSTTLARVPELAWYVSFTSHGELYWEKKDGNALILCVRGPKPNLGFYADRGDGTVDDETTGLVWQKATADIDNDGVPDKMGRDEALEYCEQLKLGGFDDWRLPNIRELMSIVDYSKRRPATNYSIFSCQSASYWSSTLNLSSPIESLGIDFYRGAWATVTQSRDMNIISGRSYVRCVRGGLPE